MDPFQEIFWKSMSDVCNFIISPPIMVPATLSVLDEGGFLLPPLDHVGDDPMEREDDQWGSIRQVVHGATMRLRELDSALVEDVLTGNAVYKVDPDLAAQGDEPALHASYQTLRLLVGVSRNKLRCRSSRSGMAYFPRLTPTRTEALGLEIAMRQFHVKIAPETQRAMIIDACMHGRPYMDQFFRHVSIGVDGQLDIEPRLVTSRGIRCLEPTPWKRMHSLSVLATRALLLHWDVLPEDHQASVNAYLGHGRMEEVLHTDEDVESIPQTPPSSPLSQQPGPRTLKRNRTLAALDAPTGPVKRRRQMI